MCDCAEPDLCMKVEEAERKAYQSFHMHFSDIQQEICTKLAPCFLRPPQVPSMFWRICSVCICCNTDAVKGRQAIPYCWVLIWAKVLVWNKKEEPRLLCNFNWYVFIVAVCQMIGLITAWRSQFTHLFKIHHWLHQCVLHRELLCRVSEAFCSEDERPGAGKYCHAHTASIVKSTINI